MEKFSTIETFVNGAGTDTLIGSVDKKAIPIALMLIGRESDALRYIDDVLEKAAQSDIVGREVEIIETSNYRKVISYPQTNNFLKLYTEFSRKFRIWAEAFKKG